MRLPDVKSRVGRLGTNREPNLGWKYMATRQVRPADSEPRGTLEAEIQREEDL